MDYVDCPCELKNLNLIASPRERRLELMCSLSYVFPCYPLCNNDSYTIYLKKPCDKQDFGRYWGGQTLEWCDKK
jgi:hypothetical protein